MKLNQDCIRDLLLYLEETLTLSSTLDIDCYSNKSFISKYNIDDLRYATMKLVEGNFINADIQTFVDIDTPYISINSITYNGHKLLDNIRDNKVWAKTKTALSKIESVSIDIISETASKVLVSLINSNS